MGKTKGFEALRKQLKELRAKTDKAVQKGLLKTAKQIELDAIAKVPVDKGILKASIGIEQHPNVIYVYASARYAAYQEFGTGPLTEAPLGFEDYAAEFKITGKGNTRPQPFLFPALFKNEPDLIANIEEELKNVANEFNRA